MKILVQKFGGTSVRYKETRKKAINHVKKALSRGYKVVAVVSAMGRKGDPYATDTLLQLIDYPNSHVSPGELDMLLSCGETISSVVFSNELNEQGVSSIAFSGAKAGFMTNREFTRARIEKVRTENIHEALKEHDVVVVAGFQGQTEDGEVTTIGRGGSDTTAAALGAALKAEYVDIFTDVNGIMTADPRIVEKARPLSVVTYNEICNLAYQGAKVIHPRAVEIAMQAKVPIRVRSTYLEDEEGTLVTASRESENGKDITDRLVTGIAHLTGIAQIKVKPEDQMENWPTAIFKAMADASISVDFINISPDTVTFTVPETAVLEVSSILTSLGCNVEVRKNCAKISTVGAGMTGVPGVTAKIVQSLTSKGIEILQSADSHTTIWVLINEDDVPEAVNALHEIFQLDQGD
ncbi:aspartate kinase [Melghiribacillus thermohalophilus]|uniref:Aspartokinase n=1 Tax=Melghiribacillus thermohalophilus TaxID=1324956 RepID=A0A4R3NDL3_9BACI|nr:aspartate kinase [Melghiribacillus thermohalophilus]TCT26715.1 aspartate kinase [Melghiribacillus thermohalophilus]